MNLAINVNDQTSADGIIHAHIIDRISSAHFQNFSWEFLDNYIGRYELNKMKKSTFKQLKFRIVRKHHHDVRYIRIDR